MEQDLRFDDSWSMIVEEFKDRNFRTLRLLTERVDGLELAMLHRQVDSDSGEHLLQGDALRDFMRRNLERALSVPGGAAVWAACVYGVCLKRWEATRDYAPVRAVGRALEWAIDRQHADEREDLRSAHALARLVSSLDACMAVENALNCSCPDDMARKASQAAARAREVQQTLRAHGDVSGSGSFTGCAAQAQRVYFQAVADMAGAVEAFIGADASSTRRLTKQIAALETAEQELDGDVYESELRAHRVTLEHMRDAADKQRLHIDEAKVIYCYAFSILGLTTEEVATGLGAICAGTLLGAARVEGAASDWDLTSAWDAHDPEGRSYRGTVLPLAPLTVTTTSGHELGPLQVELRFSMLGNCYLRISTALEGGTPHDLHQALRRGPVQMGDEQVRQPGDAVAQAWPRLNVYAQQVLDGLEQALDCRVLTSVDRRHQTVLSVRSLSLHTHDQVQPVLHYSDIEGALGASLLLQYVGHSSATLEEYIRSPRASPRALVEDLGFEGEALVRAAEATSIIMPTSPSFLVDGYEEMAELVASLPALLDLWITTLYQQREQLARSLSELDEQWPSVDTSADPLIRQAYELDHQRLKLQETITHARSTLTFLRSSALCQTVKYRIVLDRLFEAADITRLETDLEVRITEVDDLFQRLTNHMERLATHRRRQEDLRRADEETQQRKYRYLVESTLAFLAVMSLAEFIGLFNSAAAPDSFWLWVEVVTLGIAALVVGVVAWSAYRGRTRDG